MRDLPQIPGNTTLVVVVYRGKSHHVCPVITVYGVTTLACTAQLSYTELVPKFKELGMNLPAELTFDLKDAKYAKVDYRTHICYLCKVQQTTK